MVTNTIGAITGEQPRSSDPSTAPTEPPSRPCLSTREDAGDEGDLRVRNLMRHHQAEPTKEFLNERWRGSEPTRQPPRI